MPDVLQNPRPHVSFAWLLGSEEQAVEAHIEKVRNSFHGPGMAWRDASHSIQASFSFLKSCTWTNDRYKAVPPLAAQIMSSRAKKPSLYGSVKLQEWVHELVKIVESLRQFSLSFDPQKSLSLPVSLLC